MKRACRQLVWSRKIFRAACAIALLAAVAVTPASAVIIKEGDGSGNTTAPTGFPYWDNIGRADRTPIPGVQAPGSAVYLGDRWVITAKHVNVGTILLNGQTYHPAAGSAVQITDPSNGSGTDLLVYRLVTDPGLASIPLATVNISFNAAVTMIGWGLDRQAATTYWNENWVETTEPNAVYTGFKWVTNSAKSKRWGTNNVAATNQWVSTGSGQVRTFTTRFDANQIGSEGQAADGDSGGGVFRYYNNQWILTGIMLAVSRNNPRAAVYTDLTYSADITYYRNSILTAMSQVSWGDFNADQAINAMDIDLLRGNFGNPSYDLTSDAIAGASDMDYLIRGILGTEYGDINLDGKINDFDLNILAANWGRPGGWAAGDVNGDGIVDLNDLIMVSRNWNFGTTGGQLFGPAATGAGLPVPEPASIVMLAAGALALASRRRTSGDKRLYRHSTL